MNKHIKKDTETDYCYGQHKSDVQNIQTHMTMKLTKTTTSITEQGTKHNNQCLNGMISSLSYSSIMIRNTA